MKPPPLVLALFLAPACAAPPDADVGTDLDSDAVTDADTDTDADAGPVASATEGALALPFSLDAEGGGDDRLDAVALLDATGTLALDGAAHRAVAWQDHDWTAAGYHLYDVLSVAEDGSNLAVTYLYCADGAMPYAYTESFAHPMDWETSRGSCDGRAEASTAAVSLPALTALPPAFDPGVRIEGADIRYDGVEGAVTLGGVARALHPFNTVDCTDCPGGPWLEVHSLLDGADDACFAILYLYPDDPSFVQVAWGLCLPALSRTEGSLAAAWTGAVPARPPPPGLHRPRPARVRPR